MINTPDLVETLVANATPVRRLRAPIVRAAAWLLLAAAVLALIAVGHGVRPDLELRLQQPTFVISMTASLTTGVLAVFAAFIAGIPGRSRRWLLLPVPTLTLWLSSIGYGCLTDWISIQPGAITLGESARCFATLVLVSVPLLLATLFMLRYVARLEPTPVVIVGSLAVAAIASTALSLFHPLETTAMILIWNLATSVLLVALGGLCGRRVLARVAPSYSQSSLV